MNNSHIHTGPFFSLKDAAAYCSYKPDTFRKLATKYHIPRVGPVRSRFSKDTLDLFMNEPNTWNRTRSANMADNKELITYNAVVSTRATRSGKRT